MGIKILNTITEKDYSGTFTPIVSGGTTAGAATYTQQVGLYNRIGNQVTINIAVAWTAHTGTGDLIVTGLPFLPNASYNGFARCDNLTFSGELLCTAITAGTIKFFTINSGAGYSTVAMDTSASLYISITYVTTT